MKYGRSEDEWNELVDAATDYLVEVAQGRRLTNYTVLSLELVRRTGHAGFDFNLDRDQAAVGALLGEVSKRTYEEIGCCHRSSSRRPQVTRVRVSIASLES